MIGSIRRRFAGSTNADLWDVKQWLRPEPDSAPEFREASVDPFHGTTGFGPSGATMKDYYRRLVETAITQQGWYGGMCISVPWLRMTLAGLDSKAFAPEMMWEDIEEKGLDGARAPGVPSYDAIFESERALVQKLGLR